MMPHAQVSAEKLQQLRDFAQQWGEIIARRAGIDVDQLDFDDIETIAQTVAAGLLEGTVQAFLQPLADNLQPQLCPQCARPCPVTVEERPLLVRGGVTVQHPEPLAHCPTCRRDFFPPTDSTSPG